MTKSIFKKHHEEWVKFAQTFKKTLHKNDALLEMAEEEYLEDLEFECKEMFEGWLLAKGIEI